MDGRGGNSWDPLWFFFRGKFWYSANGPWIPFVFVLTYAAGENAIDSEMEKKDDSENVGTKH